MDTETNVESKKTKKKKTAINKTMVNSKETSRVKDISNIEHLEEVSNADPVVVRRQVGDGESLPNTPPNETIDDDALASKNNSQESLENQPKFYSPFTLQINIDVMAVMLFLVGLGTRLFRLDQPYNVVFDEMHYGKYANLYLKKTFFFDANPPLGKLLIALAGYLYGYDGSTEFGFDKIGTPFPEDVPHVVFRLVPALFGSLLTPTVFLILCELNVTVFAGYLASFMIVFDTALLTQSRFILLESMMIFFALMAVLSALKMRQYYDRPFGFGWTFWLIAASVNIGLAFSVKYLAFYSCALCITILLRDFWCRRLGNRKVSNMALFIEICTESAVLCIVPITIYVGLFYVHLCILTKAGHHDSLMTSAFQASLDGGLSSIIRGQPLAVAHGSQITLRHTHGRTCWLHSHEHVYPIRYPDGRGSSHQQQVSCYSYKDINNWWIVKRPDKEDLKVIEPLDMIKNGDVIQLVHGMTHRALNSHDVAAAMSPQNQEVTCYIDYNISMSAENLWRVDITNQDENDNVWHSIGSQVRLIHVNSEQALRYSGKVYADWGFHQNEVVCDKQIAQLDTIWNVEEHRYTKEDENNEKIEKELFGAELIPESPTNLSFMEKFLELQIKMLITNQENVQNHNYASDPSEWPFLTRGIAYYISKKSNAQVHLLGNVAIWYTCSLGVLFYSILLGFYLLRRRRLCYDISEESWQHFITVGEVLYGGYIFHFIPFFFYDRTLFVHHYLPAYIYKIMLTSFLISHIYENAKNIRALRILMLIFMLIWSIGSVKIFHEFSSLSYGIYPLSSDEVKDLRWKDSWDLIIHKA